MIRSAVLCVFLLFYILSKAQSGIGLQVYDEVTGAPVLEGTVFVLSSPDRSLVRGGDINKAGITRLRLPEGTYILDIRSEGYQPLLQPITVGEAKGTPSFYQFYLTPLTLARNGKTTNQENRGRVKKITRVAGRVSLTGQPLPSHEVHLLNTNREYVQGGNISQDGKFKMSVPEGEYWLVVKKERSIIFEKKILVSGSDLQLGNIGVSSNEETITSKQYPDKKISEIIVKGTIVDSISLSPVDYAVLSFTNNNDSTVKTSEAIDKGTFWLKLLPGDYTVRVQAFGCHTLTRNVQVGSQDMDLGNIRMSKNSILLDEAVVTAKAPSVRVKGDTIEYRVESYLRDENALLQDLIKDIPGVTIDSNGNLFANGKQVTRILIDGKDFFGNDIQLALKNLPANMIGKLQLFREETELEKIIAFVNDFEDKQVMNLELKDDFKQSLFGDIQTGYGDEQYLHRALINYMSDKWQVSLLGNMNNINEDAQDPGSFSDDTGINKTKDAGLNVNYRKDESFKIGGNVLYSKNESLFESEDISEYFLSTGNHHFIGNTISQGDSKKSSFEINSSWTPKKSPFSVFFKAWGDHNDYVERNTTTGISYVAQSDTTTTREDFRYEGSEKSLKGLLVLGWKFNDKGRALSLSLNGSLKMDKGNGANQSVTSYQSEGTEKEIDQILDKDNKTNSFTATASYVEPLSKEHSLLLSYTLNKGKTTRNNNVYKQGADGEYTAVDSAYTRRNENKYLYQIFSLGFQGRHDKVEYNTVLNIEPSKLNEKIGIKDLLIQDIDQDNQNYSASFRFAYKPKKNVAFHLNYNGTMSQPSVAQISGDTVIVNSLYRVYGNTGLKGSFTNNVSLQYQKSDFATGRFFLVSAGLNWVNNRIVEKYSIDSQGNTLSTYDNVNGNWNANWGLVFNSPLRNDNFAFDSNTNLSFNRNVGIINENESKTNNYSASQYMALSFNSDIVETQLQVSYAYMHSNNNLTEQKNLNSSVLRIGNSLLLHLPLDFLLQNDINYTYNTGYSENFQNNELLWNASLSKSFLKKKNGFLKFQIYDILNNRNNVSRSVNTTYVTNTKTNAVGQYFLFSFIYRFNLRNKTLQKD